MVLFGWLTQENGILLLLGFTFGLVFFHSTAVGVLGTRGRRYLAYAIR